MNKHASSSKINILLLKTQRDKPLTLIAMQRLPDPNVVLIYSVLKFLERKIEVPDDGLETPFLHRVDVLVVGVPIHRPELDYVSRIKEDHEVPEVANLLARVIDRHRRDSEHLVTSRTAN